MKDERRAREAMREYARLVVILNDEDWADGAPKLLEEEIGRRNVGREAFKSYAAAREAFDEAMGT